MDIRNAYRGFIDALRAALGGTTVEQIEAELRKARRAQFRAASKTKAVAKRRAHRKVARRSRRVNRLAAQR